MQLDLSKVVLRSTLSPTPKVEGRSRKDFVLDCVYSYKDWVSDIYNPRT